VTSIFRLIRLHKVPLLQYFKVGKAHQQESYLL